MDYVIDDVFPKNTTKALRAGARIKTLSLSLSICVSFSFSANVSNREWILGSVGVTFNHVFSTYNVEIY